MKKEVEAAPAVITIGGGGAVASTSAPAETKPNTTTPPPTETKPVETKPVESTPAETKPVESKPVATSTPTETKPVESKPVSTTTAPSENKATSTSAKSSASAAGMTFKVQLGAYSNQPSKSKFSDVGSVNIDLINGMYKVTTGNFKTLEEAVKYRDELKSKGYNGFIAKYKDGVRIN